MKYNVHKFSEYLNSEKYIFEIDVFFNKGFFSLIILQNGYSGLSPFQSSRDASIAILKNIPIETLIFIVYHYYLSLGWFDYLIL